MLSIYWWHKGRLAYYRWFIEENDIDLRVITDIETGFIRHDTFDDFIENHPNSIRTLKSLHTKIYIVDDWCLVSSANLTGTAFSKRYEIGTDDVNIGTVGKC